MQTRDGSFFIPAKVRLFFFLLPGLGILFLSGCSSGGTALRFLIPGKEYVLPAKEVALHFGDLFSTDKPYTRLEKIEVEGGRFATVDELIRKLQVEARQMGAHAVVEIRPLHRKRSSYTVFHSKPALEDLAENKEYQAMVLQGVAIVFSDDNQLVAVKKPEQQMTSPNR